MNFNPDTTAVVVIDMQNGFCHPDGSLYAPASEEAIDPVNDVIATARDAGAKIIFTQDVHPEDQFKDAHYYDEFARWGEHVVEDTWDAALHDDLAVDPEDKIVEKHTYDAFYRTELHGWLAARNITDLLFCGTLANVCVLHSAGSAGLRDYRPVLVTDAIGFLEIDHKEYAVTHADWLFGETLEIEDISFTTEAIAD